MSTPTLLPTVTVPSDALKAFIKSTSEIVAEAMEADVKIDAELEGRWLKAAGELQKAVESGKPEVKCGNPDLPSCIVCELPKGHGGWHQCGPNVWR